jgi:hypothetical protein
MTIVEPFCRVSRERPAPSSYAATVVRLSLLVGCCTEDDLLESTGLPLSTLRATVATLERESAVVALRGRYYPRPKHASVIRR